MQSFKNYAKDAAKVANVQAREEEVVEQTGKSDAEALAKKIATAYHGKSNADMWRNILMEAEKSKRAGALSNEEIEQFYQSFSPMLDNFQRKQLRAVIDRLKEI